MIIETAFQPGDKGWAFVEGVRQLTIGQVRVEITDSPGLDGETIFDNFKPQTERKESYMCVETGIGSGTLYTLGEHIFASREACEAANAKRIEAMEVERQRQTEARRLDDAREEESLRRRLAEIERKRAIANHD
jgi:hypothetical protein